MNSIIEIFSGLVLGAIVMYWLYGFFRKKQSKELTVHQSNVLLKKIKNVCKLVSVEGDFAEIYKYENTKERFMSLVTSKKKALIIINAKVQIGYNITKILLHADNEKKSIILTNFPEPEVLSIEPELEIYDIKSGMFNSFSPDDLTTLNKEAKQHILEKIPESGLMETAKKQVFEATILMESLVDTIGWKLDYSRLQISDEQKQLWKK